MTTSSKHLHAVSLSTVLLLAALSGFLIFLSIPKIDWWPLAWVCLIPVLIALHDMPQRVYAIGLTFGFVAGVGKVYWITETVVNYGGLNFLLGVFSMMVVALLLGLYAIVFCIFIARTSWQSAAFPVMAAAMWTALELIQTFLLTGFPWELLGYSQYRVLPVIQIANVTGVYGVSFLVVLVNATLAQTLIAIRDGAPWQPIVHAMSVACVALVCTVAYGFIVLSRTPAQASHTSPLRVSVVQGSVEQGLKWSDATLQQTIDIYDSLTQSILGAEPEFIVFPETAMTFYLESPRYTEQADQVYRLVEKAGVPLLTGALGYRLPDVLGYRQPDIAIYNSVFLLAPGHGIVGRYSKMHLVPFGEYLPWPWLFSWLSGLTDDIGVLTPGENLTVMALPNRNVRIGTVICYESIFPDLVRRFVDGGANVLVVMTNDAWFGTSSAPMQHFSMAVLRAVENGVPIIRAANTGISGFISATGEISGLTPLLMPTTTTQSIRPVYRTPTLYTQYGDVFGVVCCLLALVGAVRVSWKRENGGNG